MNFWQKTKRFLEPAFEDKWTFIFLTGIASLAGTSTWYIQIYMIEVITRSFSGESLDNFWNILWAIVFAFAISLVFIWTLRNYVWCIPQIGMENAMIREYFIRFFKGNANTIENFWTGRMINIIWSGTDKWSMLLNDTVTNVSRWVGLLSLSVVILLKISSVYVWMFFIMFVLIMLNLIIFSRYWYIMRLKRKNIYVEKSRQQTKMIMNKFEVLQNNRILSEIKKLVDINIDIRQISQKIQSINVWTWQISRVIIATFTLSICVLFYERAITEGITPLFIAELGSIMGLMATFSSYFNLLIEWYITFTKEIVHVEKLWDFIDNTPVIEWYDTGKKFELRNWDYELRDVEFAYHSQASVLENFSVKISGGKKTALVGRSWGGKTTIMKLLAGYMRPTGWKLMIDGQDITEIRLDSYYPHIGYLTQEPSVFDGTIEENLLYGARGKVSKEQLKRAIELSECQFIYELEDGIKTEIGERGVRLSWGQKQRLAIAKIFLKDPEIILLDEPTAALDSYSEEKVARAFEHLFVGRTVVVIAHRLQTVKSADDIIVVEKWKIVERWTHTQLLKLWKKYAGMVDLQSGIVREDDNEEKYAN